MGEIGESDTWQQGTLGGSLHQEVPKVQKYPEVASQSRGKTCRIWHQF